MTPAEEGIAAARREAQEAQEIKRRNAAYPAMIIALKEAAPLLREYAESCGPCDHEVNICICGIMGVEREVHLALNLATGKHDQATCASAKQFGARCEDCAPDWGTS